MKRKLSAVALAAAVVGTLGVASTASAASPSRTSITLACDREVTARATVVLWSAGGAKLDDLSVSCGPRDTAERRDRMVVTQPAQSIDVIAFSLTTPASPQPFDCRSSTDTPLPLPLRQDCVDETGAGARLVVR